MPDNVNITVNETIENIVINPSVLTDVIDINTYSTAETIDIAITPNVITVNVNSVTNTGSTPTLQQVLDNNHDLVNGNNFQGTNAGLGNTGYNVNANGESSGQANRGNDVNANGQNSVNNNTGSNVNAFGLGAGNVNTFNNVNLFGRNSQADADNQTVFSKDGANQARISFANITGFKKVEIPNKNGTFAYLDDVTTAGANKVDKVTGKSLILDTEITRLAGVTNYDNSSNVTALSGKENTITAGTTSQYYRGDKTFQTLDKTSVGLSNVDNTSDANKPISTATQTALDLKASSSSLASAVSALVTSLTLKEDSSNKSTTTSDSASTTKFPVWSAIVSYISSLGFITNVVTALGYTPLNKAGDTITGDIGNTSTGFFRVASGTTAQRLSTPVRGDIRENSTTNRFEFYSNGAWRNNARLEGDTFTGAITATNLSGTNTGDETASTIIAKIGTGGLINQSYLPSYVDDVLEFANFAGFPTTGETGKIYIAIDSSKQYRWTGSVYLQITNGLIASSNDVPEGSNNLYFTTARVLSTLLSGLSIVTGGAIVSTDSVLVSFGKIQKQINDALTTISGLMVKSANGSDIANIATFRANLGVDKITSINNINYTILATDKVVSTSATLTVPRTFTLPLANSINAGYEIIVADLFGGVSSVNTLTVAISGSDTVNNVSSAVIGATFGMRRFITDGISKWTFDAGVMRISDYIGTTLTASKVVVTDANSKLAPSTVSVATLNFLDATSSVQTQINTKQDKSGYLTIVSSATPVTLTASSPRFIIVTGTIAQVINLPVTSTLDTSTMFNINNTSTASTTVNSSGGNQVGSTLANGVTANFYCILITGTTAASWQQQFSGSPTRTGAGNLVYSSFPFLSVPSYSSNAAFTAGTNAQGQGQTTTDVTVVATTAAIPSGVTLLSAGTASRHQTVINNGTNPINIYPQTGGQINNLGTNMPYYLAVNGSMTFNSTSSTQWYSEIDVFRLSSLRGTVSVSATAQTAFTVTFGGTQPNNTYFVGISALNALTAAQNYIMTKTTTSFTVTFLTGLTGTVNFDYVLHQ